MSRTEDEVRGAIPQANEIARGPERAREAAPQPTNASQAGTPLPEIPGGERFVRRLDERLAESELGERGWKGRDDLTDVLDDLRKLSEVNFQRAADLWAKYRPDDRDKPAFLDSDELAQEARRRRPAAAREEEPSREPAVPDAVRRRFLQAENRYYYRDQENALAFEDHGNRLATKHDDPMVALSMVQLADSKGWQSVTLRGSQEFRREAWLQASLKGMEVEGYKPREVDVKKLEEMRHELGNAPERPARASSAHEHRAPRPPSSREAVDKDAVVDEPQRALTPQQRVVLETVKAVWRQQGATDREVEIASAATAERFQNQRVYVGRVTEHGAAPYEHNSKNERSYFVKLQRPEGDKVVWGVDLRRALEAGGIELGDQVVVANQGRQAVQVPVKERDENGAVKGTTVINATRNAWRIDEVGSLREDARAQLERAAARADRDPLVPVYDRSAARSIERPAFDAVPSRARDDERVR